MKTLITAFALFGFLAVNTLPSEVHAQAAAGTPTPPAAAPATTLPSPMAKQPTHKTTKHTAKKKTKSKPTKSSSSKKSNKTQSSLFLPSAGRVG